MTVRHVSPTIIDALKLPNLVRLGTNLYGAAFFLMKLLPAHFILENARDAVLPGGGAITVVTNFEPNGTKGSNKVYLEISDTGPGIAHDTQRKIFEPFFTTKPKGTGLGLALAKKFVEANDGTVRSGNGTHGGALFRLTFPTSHPA